MNMCTPEHTHICTHTQEHTHAHRVIDTDLIDRANIMTSLMDLIACMVSGGFMTKEESQCSSSLLSLQLCFVIPPP